MRLRLHRFRPEVTEAWSGLFPALYASGALRPESHLQSAHSFDPRRSTQRDVLPSLDQAAGLSADRALTDEFGLDDEMLTDASFDIAPADGLFDACGLAEEESAFEAITDRVHRDDFGDPVVGTKFLDMGPEPAALVEWVPAKPSAAPKPAAAPRDASALAIPLADSDVIHVGDVPASAVEMVPEPPVSSLHPISRIPLRVVKGQPEMPMMLGEPVELDPDDLIELDENGRPIL